MKLLFTIFLLFLTHAYSQTFLEIMYNNGDPLNTTDLSLIDKISFTGSQVTFELTDNSSVIKDLSIIEEISYSSSDGGNPLPVELTSFTADVNGEKVSLRWTTSNEVDNYGFEVERLKDYKIEKSQGWEKVGFVQGSGNSNSTKIYSFADNLNFTYHNHNKDGLTLKYRLKQIDTDGKFEYSDIVEVSLIKPTEFSLEQNFPNPFNPETKIVYNISEDGFVSLKVFDILGNEVADLVNENKKAGSYTATFSTTDGNGSNLASGIYFAKMSSAKYKGIIKMLMLK